MKGQCKGIKSPKRLSLIAVSIFLLVVSAIGLDCSINSIENIYKDGGKTI